MEITELQEAVELMSNGGTLIYPTDTIRGIGCDATNEAAVEKVYEIKNRPKEKSMIVLVSSYEMLASYGVELSVEQKTFLEHAQKPTTIILNGIQGLASNVYHADGSLGVRIVKADETNPGANWCHTFIETFAKPIVSTSANMSGDESPLTFSLINPELLTSADAYISAEIADIQGSPSQVVRIDTDGKVTILRP